MKRNCKIHGKTEYKQLEKDVFICLECHKDFVDKSKIKLDKKGKLQDKEKIKPYKVGDMESIVDFNYWKEKYKMWRMKKYLFLVIMKLRSGQYEVFTASSKTKTFVKDNSMYYIDSDMARRDSTSKLDVYFYHQDIATPFLIDYDLEALNKKLDSSDKNIKKSLNPTSLKEFINSNIIEKILRGAELSNDLKFLKMLVIINLIITFICCALIAKSTGLI